MTRLILASASPQRKTLLEGLGLKFKAVPSSVDEAACPEPDPVIRARVLAEMKAKDVWDKNKSAWVIGCDTLVVSPDGTLFEKPENADEARHMIKTQSGRMSTVHSGLSLLSPDGRHAEGVSSSDVTFKRLTEREIDWWVEKGKWEGRSGSFQIDGLGQFLISEIRGDWTSIVGFPVFLFGQLLEELKAPFVF
ncbi:MAG: Maf family protein [Candidatus Peribacteraceae bacterium]|jgi:septum formation protein